MAWRARVAAVNRLRNALVRYGQCGVRVAGASPTKGGHAKDLRSG
jgi:hypothetical protein